MPAKSHGMTNTKEYRTWENMRKRCHKPNDPHYPRWGGRGIFVCDRWRHSFQNFFDDIGPCPSIDHTIERIDNNGPYSPENCRWAHKSEQAANTKKNVFLTHNGETKTVTEWARTIGMAESALKARIYQGWTTEQALTTPSKPGNRRVNRLITHDGETKTITKWAEQYGISVGKLWRRLQRGLQMHDALTRPSQQRRRL